MMALTTYAAAWFLPFVLPICLYVVYTDISRMKITNVANLALAAVFVVIGLIVFPFDTYLWRLASLVIVLIVGIVLNAAGVMGAGDSKFIAAAAPILILVICASCWCCLPPFSSLPISHTAQRNILPCADLPLIGSAGSKARNSPWASLLAQH